MARNDMIQYRRDTAANWASANPVLADGEVGFDRDHNEIRIGNGVQAWVDLKRIGGNSVEAADAALAAIAAQVAAEESAGTASSARDAAVVSAEAAGDAADAAVPAAQEATAAATQAVTASGDAVAARAAAEAAAGDAVAASEALSGAVGDVAGLKTLTTSGRLGEAELNASFVSAQIAPDGSITLSQNGVPL